MRFYLIAILHLQFFPQAPEGAKNTNRSFKPRKWEIKTKVHGTEDQMIYSDGNIFHLVFLEAAETNPCPEVCENMKYRMKLS